MRGGCLAAKLPRLTPATGDPPPVLQITCLPRRHSAPPAPSALKEGWRRAAAALLPLAAVVVVVEASLRLSAAPRGRQQAWRGLRCRGQDRACSRRWLSCTAEPPTPSSVSLGQMQPQSLSAAPLQSAQTLQPALLTVVSTCSLALLTHPACLPPACLPGPPCCSGRSCDVRPAEGGAAAV